MEHRYRVEAECQATCTEVWEFRSDRPLAREEIERVLSGMLDDSLTTAQPIPGVEVDFIREAVSDEHNRRVVAIEET